MFKQIKSKDVSLYTEAFGDVNSIPILFISGAMAPSLFWPDSFCQSIVSKGFFVIRFDNRDFGKSTHFEQCRPNSEIECPYTINDMVEDCIAVLDCYGIEKCNIVGHSMGGSIAQLLTVYKPDRVLSAISLSAPLLGYGCPDLKEPDLVIQQRTWDVFLKNPMYSDKERGIPEFLKVWEFLNGSYSLDYEMARNYTAKIYETEVIEPAWNHTKVQEGISDIFPLLLKSKIPLLLIHGEEDNLVQNAKNIEIMAKQVESISTCLLKKAGHVFFNRDIWRKIENVIYEFISENR